MANAPILTFAGGELGGEAMARVALEGYSAHAAVMENWLPDTSGMMTFRPGFEFKVRPTTTDSRAWLVPFVVNSSSKYLLVLTDSAMRVVQDGGIITRATVDASITDGAFPNLLNWVDVSDVGGTASASGSLSLTGTGTAKAAVSQTVATASVGVVHAVDVVVERGPVTLKIGTAADLADLLPGAAEITLRTGVHSIAFTPTGASFVVELSSTARAVRLVTSIEIGAAGDMVLTTPWPEAIIPTLERQHSIDVLFMSSGVGPRQRIERRASNSWSIVETAEADGPFLSPNVDEGINMTPSVTAGNGTLTCSRDYFNADHVGALFEMTHSGQSAVKSAGGTNQWSDPIKVQGAGTTARTFTYSIAGTFSATVVIQRSIGNTSAWADYQSFTTTVASATINDGLDNQTVYYRIGIGSTYASGTADVTLTYTGGSSTGVVRVIGYTSKLIVDMEVLDTLAATTATNEWAEGAWSGAQSWTKGDALFDGRLWAGYNDRFAGSMSDAYESFQIGENADDSVQRSIATGNVEPIVALVPLLRLVALTSNAEVELRSSSFDEPITPSNLSTRPVSTNGAAPVHPAVIDNRGIFIARNGTRAMELVYDSNSSGYQARSLHRFNKTIGKPGLEQIAVARHPTTRVFFTRSDGQLLVLLHEVADEVSGWSRIVTDGLIESVAVLPASDEDEVYLMVKRTINGNTRRYLEKLGSLYLDDAADARQLDSWVEVVNGTPSDTVTGADHLEAKTVRIWADGARMPDKVVSGGSFTLPRAKTNVVYGLPYTGPWKSVKLSFGAQGGTALSMRGKPTRLALLLYKSMPILKYGQSFTRMDDLKDRDVESQYDSGPSLTTGTTADLAFPDGLSRDPRLCLQAESPYWVQLQGIVVSNQLNER